MESAGRVYGGLIPSSSEVLDSLWISNSSPSFHGDSVSCSTTSMVNFEDVIERNPTKMPFFPALEREENGSEEGYGACFHQPEKKRRLTADQVHFLERSFEVENKLEPERKVQLAKELGLQPRQVAIWFQNRRARSKTKQLEKDFDSLKATYDNLKVDYDCLLKENEILKNQVHLLTEKMLLRDKENSSSEPNHPINPMFVELDKQNHINADTEAGLRKSVVLSKQEDTSSGGSDVLDSESPHCTEGNHSSFLEPTDYSQPVGPEQSDEEDELTRSLLPPPCSPKLEDHCYNDPPGNCYNWSFPMEGGQPSWLWPYY